MEQQTPPAYTESQAPAPAFNVPPPQSPGYSQEHSFNVGQAYNAGQGYNVGQGQGYNVGQGQGYNMGQGYNVAQPPYVANPGCSQIFYSCQPGAATATGYENYKSRQSIILGAAQITIGILCIIFNAVLIGISEIWSLGPIAHGIWGGVLFIIAGSFGVAGGKKKAKCVIVTYMILSILATLAAAVIFILAVIGLIIASNENSYSYYYSSYPYYSYSYTRRPDNYGAAMAMNILLVILSFIAGVSFIWGSALCCCLGGGCCRGSTMTYVAASQPVQFVPVNGNQQILYITQPTPIPQYAPYPGYPVQMVGTAPTYQPLMHPGVGQINQGFTGQPEQKRQIDENPNVV